MVLAIPGRYLRNKVDGTIYGYSEEMAMNELVEEVPEELAFPERFIPAAQVGRDPKVDLATDETEVEAAKAPPVENVNLNGDASKGLVAKPAKKAPAKRAKK